MPFIRLQEIQSVCFESTNVTFINCVFCFEKLESNYERDDVVVYFRRMARISGGGGGAGQYSREGGSDAARGAPGTTSAILSARHMQRADDLFGMRYAYHRRNYRGEYSVGRADHGED